MILDKQAALKWYDKKVLVFILTALCFPIGIYCVIKSKILSNKFKIRTIFIIPVIYFFSLLFCLDKYYGNKYNNLHSSTLALTDEESLIVEKNINTNTLHEITIQDFVNNQQINNVDKLKAFNQLRKDYLELFRKLDFLVKQTMFHLKRSSDIPDGAVGSLVSIQQTLSEDFGYKMVLCLEAEASLSNQIDENKEIEKIQVMIKEIRTFNEQEINKNLNFLERIGELIM